MHKIIGFEQKLALMQKIAAEIRQLHTSRMQHGCLYAKHIFVKLDENYQNPEVAFIDFEKARIRLWSKARTARDLRVLPRDSPRAAQRTTPFRFLGLSEANFMAIPPPKE